MPFENLSLGGASLRHRLITQQRDETIELAVDLLHPIDYGLGRLHWRQLLSLYQGPQTSQAEIAKFAGFHGLLPLYIEQRLGFDLAEVDGFQGLNVVKQRLKLWSQPLQL